MSVKIVTGVFDPLDEIRRLEISLADSRSSIGASSFFVGNMRDSNEGRTVHSMLLEHYPGMTEKRLKDIESEARAKWDLNEVLIVHRVGEIHPGESIVLVAVWSVHRAQAFESCRGIMEKLKSTAPFWKKETSSDGDRWVRNNTSGYIGDA